MDLGRSLGFWCWFSRCFGWSATLWSLSRNRVKRKRVKRLGLNSMDIGRSLGFWCWLSRCFGNLDDFTDIAQEVLSPANSQVEQNGVRRNHVAALQELAAVHQGNQDANEQGRHYASTCNLMTHFGCLMMGTEFSPTSTPNLPFSSSLSMVFSKRPARGLASPPF